MDFKKFSANVYNGPRNSSAYVYYNTNLSYSMWWNAMLDEDLHSLNVFLANFNVFI